MATIGSCTCFCLLHFYLLITRLINLAVSFFFFFNSFTFFILIFFIVMIIVFDADLQIINQ